MSCRSPAMLLLPDFQQLDFYDTWYPAQHHTISAAKGTMVYMNKHPADGYQVLYVTIYLLADKKLTQNQRSIKCVGMTDLEYCNTLFQFGWRQLERNWAEGISLDSHTGYTNYILLLGAYRTWEGTASISWLGAISHCVYSHLLLLKGREEISDDRLEELYSYLSPACFLCQVKRESMRPTATQILMTYQLAIRMDSQSWRLSSLQEMANTTSDRKWIWGW